MSIVRVTGGVDTHADVHVAAAIDHNGGVLGIESFLTNEAGYESLAGWLAGFGPVNRVGVEGTGSYGVGLARFLAAEMRNIDRTLTALIGDTAPSLLALYGLGPDTAASLLVAAGDNPERLHSERAWAHLCGVTPIPASSGKVTRYRLNRGGDRNANAAVYRIVLTRMSSHDQTRSYVTRRRAEGLNTAEIMRCLKRYVARQVYKHLPVAA